MTTKICLIGPTHPSANPRLVRDAQALAAAGYEVVAVTTRLMPHLVLYDRELEGQDWEHKFVDLSSKGLRWQFARTRRRICLALASRSDTETVVARGCAYAGPEMAALAADERAALYIAHAHAALPAAAEAARRTGAMLAFDAEDLLAESSDEPVRVIRAIERRLVPTCNYLSTMSRAAALRLQETLGLPEAPLVLHNTPSLADRKGVLPPMPRAPDEPLRIYWFGQTLGRHSCADQVLRAFPMLHKPARLILRGEADPIYLAKIEALANQLGVRDQLEIHPRAGPKAMVRLAAPYDLLLGSQPSSEPFHQMAVGNKVFTGLMAGLALALTDTTAHRLLLKELPGCGFLFPNDDARTLATLLNDWMADSPRLLAARMMAWTFASERFNWEFESRALLARIANLVGAP